ncbi:protein DCL, chloroplastic isoform X2 [Telopea speciosissima]|uniref:protein DCL, chloroplastic isoform X2 n=1 Tax=Telopea speciosissima TaxID=54955 RepID=UPI001CC6768C|nr:protein DCL, chloroplastic isoform X2 [Telopea speciosissima]
MASFSSSPLLYLSKNPISFNFPPPIVFFLPCNRHVPSLHLRSCALKTGSDGGSVRSRDGYNSELLRKPVMSPIDDDAGSAKAAVSDSDVGEPAEEGKKGYNQSEEDEWVDWEDRILQDTVPLVGFVRMILHSGRYGSGDKLSPEHEKTIVERLLPYHPEVEKKIGCGIDYITLFIFDRLDIILNLRVLVACS